MILRHYSRNELAAVLFRLVQVVAWFLSARLIITHAGAELYGFVSLMFSFAVWLQMFDFGVTSFLRSELPRRHVEGGLPASMSFFLGAVRKVLASTAALLLLLNALLLIVPALAPFALDALSAGSVVTPNEFRLVFAVLSLYGFMLIAGNTLQAQLGALKRQHVFLEFSILGCLLQPLLVWLSVRNSSSVVLAFSVCCLTPVVIAFSYFLAYYARQSRKFTALSAPRILNRTSTSFLIIQLGGAVVSNLDLVLVSNLFGLEASAAYSIFKLLVQFPISVHAQFNLQSWPLYAELSALTGDRAPLRRLVLRNSAIAAVAAAMTSLGLILLGPWFIQFWSAGALTGTHTTAALFALFATVYILSNTFSILMFAFNHTRDIVMLVWVGPPFFILAAWLLRGYGPDGVILSNAVAHSFGLVAGAMFFRKLCLKRS